MQNVSIFVLFCLRFPFKNVDAVFDGENLAEAGMVSFFTPIEGDGGTLFIKSVGYNDNRTRVQTTKTRSRHLYVHSFFVVILVRQNLATDL